MPWPVRTVERMIYRESSPFIRINNFSHIAKKQRSARKLKNVLEYSYVLNGTWKTQNTASHIIWNVRFCKRPVLIKWITRRDCNKSYKFSQMIPNIFFSNVLIYLRLWLFRLLPSRQKIFLIWLDQNFEQINIGLSQKSRKCQNWTNLMLLNWSMVSVLNRLCQFVQHTN